MKLHEPTLDMEAFRKEALALMRKHAGHLSAMEMLGILAYTTGQCIALQDSRKVTAEIAMQVVRMNIQKGNADAVGEHLSLMPRA
jgi:hypothetical protein